MKKPLVSIGLIAYNRDHTLESAIKSLLAQSYKNIELIISDDASADQTPEVCGKYAKKDKRIIFFRQKKNLGLSANSNFVLNKAKGKYFIWASDDDIWHKDFIGELVSILERDKKTVLAMSNFYLFKNSHKYHEEIKLEGKFTGLNLILTYLKKRPLLVWGVFRTDTLKSCGGFHTDRRPIYQGSDMLTVFKVLLEGNLVVSPKTLFFKRDSGFAVNPYELLQKNIFTKDTRNRIFRYLHYPLFFTLDLYYYTKYTLFSKLSMSSKIITIIYIIVAYISLTIELVFKIVKGLGVFFLNRL